jgi:hypothetical protein
MDESQSVSMSAYGYRRKRRWKRVLWVSLVALLVLPTTCLLTAHLCLRVPPVEGVILDGTTGKPVVGAHVFFSYKGHFRGPLAIVGGANRSVLAAGETVTDAEGRFRFPGSTLSRELDEAPYWPRAMGIQLTVRSKETMPVWSKAGGLNWTEDPFYQQRQMGVKVERTNSRSATDSYKYRVMTSTPRTEQEWEEKVIQTSYLAGQFGGKASEQFLYDDCVAFVERYPSNPLAGECVFALVLTSRTDTAARLRDDIEKGVLKRSELPSLIARGRRVLELSKRVAQPSPSSERLDFRVKPMAAGYKEEMTWLQECVDEMQRIVDKGGER